MLPTLPTQKDNYGKPNAQARTSRQCCRNVLSFAEKKRRECFYNLILPFCPTTFLTQPSAPYFSSLAARTSAAWSWPALPKLYQIGRSFSFQIDILEKQKKDYDMIRPITGDVLRGRSNRNPSNILNGFCFSKCQDAV